MNPMNTLTIAASAILFAVYANIAWPYLSYKAGKVYSAIIRALKRRRTFLMSALRGYRKPTSLCWRRKEKQR